MYNGPPCAQPWLTPMHPDPRGDHLELLASVLKVFLSDVGGTYAIFLDYMSLYQRDENGLRTDEESRMMGFALTTLADLYAHQFVYVLKLTQQPVDYPHGKGFNMPPEMQANIAKYMDRGWCFTESCMSGLVKAARLVLDMDNFETTQATLEAVVEACSKGRPPPLSPVDFAVKVMSLRFTNAKTDSKLVKDLYTRAFEQKCACAEVLDYQGLGWHCEQAFGLANALRGCTQVREVHLQRNMIGTNGLQAIAKAIKERDVAPRLVQVWVDTTPSNAEGKQAIADALAEKKAMLGKSRRNLPIRN